MDKERVKKSLDLINSTSAAYLTTIDSNGFPYTRAMLNLRSSKHFPKLVDFMSEYGNNFTLFFTTNTSSSKITQIKNNPKVSVYYCDANIFFGLMCQGEIEIVTDKTIKNAIWLDEWLMYYPEGKDSEDYTILKLKPSNVRTYYQFHQSDMNP